MKAKRIMHTEKADEVIITMDNAEAAELFSLLQRIRENVHNNDVWRISLYTEDYAFAELFEYTQSLLGFE